MGKIYHAFREEEALSESAEDSCSSVGSGISVPPAVSFAEVFAGDAFAQHVATMFDLCKEDHSLGPYSRMPPSSRDRALRIRGELWDVFEAICSLFNFSPTPESLSSCAG